MARILITDAEQRSSLAAVRSLGRAGHEVHVCSHEADPLAGASRFCADTHIVPDPSADASAFTEAVHGLISALRADVVMPMTDVAAPLVLPLRARHAGLVIPFPALDTYVRASDKHRLTVDAAELGIPVPRQAVVRAKGDVVALPPGVVLPVVLKPARSAMTRGNAVSKVGVRVVGTEEEMVGAMADYPAEAYPILVQERIAGPGLGAFMLTHEGATIAAFGHRRIREKPPRGGVSVYRESVPLRADVREYSERLLAGLAWTGVAMVEFKEDAATGIPYLMEVNARFWGSLQLAIDAGVDFPRLLIALTLGESVAPVATYRTPVRSRWLWGDVDHLLAILRAPAGYRIRNPELPSRLGALARFLVPWKPGDRFEVLRAGDLRPFLRESSQWFTNLRR